MRSIFRHSGFQGYNLGQADIVSSLISTAITSGVQFEIAREQRLAMERAAKEQQKFQLQLKQQAEAAEQKRQEDVMKAQQVQQAAAAGGGPVPGASSQVLGVDSSTFYVGAGVLGIGAVVATLLATR